MSTKLEIQTDIRPTFRLADTKQTKIRDTDIVSLGTGRRLPTVFQLDGPLTPQLLMPLAKRHHMAKHEEAGCARPNTDTVHLAKKAVL